MNKNDLHINKQSWLVVFIILFYCPILLSLALQRKYRSNVENNEIIEKPQISIESYCDYAKNFEAWFGDVLPWRDEFITLNSSLEYFIFRESAANKVIVGKQNWLFFAETLNDYKGTNLYTEAELQELRKNLLVSKNYLDARGIEFIVFIAPNKASIYGNDYLPKYIRRQNELSRTQQLANYIDQTTDLKILFPIDALIQAKYDFPDSHLYLHLDTHWNYWGGYNGAKALLRALNINPPDIDINNFKEINAPAFTWNGYDLANMLGMTEVLKTDTNYNIGEIWQEKYATEQDAVKSKEDFLTYIRTKANNADKRKIMFIRDSFGTAMLPFLASSFAEIYSPHEAYFTQESISVENPDIVVLELVERSDISWFRLTD